MTILRCNGFIVYPPSVFYPISWKNWEQYFNPNADIVTRELINNALGIHVWNKFAQTKIIDVGSAAPYTVAANKHCPMVYQNCGRFF